MNRLLRKFMLAGKVKKRKRLVYEEAWHSEIGRCTKCGRVRSPAIQDFMLQE